MKKIINTIELDPRLKVFPVNNHSWGSKNDFCLFVEIFKVILKDVILNEVILKICVLDFCFSHEISTLNLQWFIVDPCKS